MILTINRMYWLTIVTLRYIFLLLDVDVWSRISITWRGSIELPKSTWSGIRRIHFTYYAFSTQRFVETTLSSVTICCHSLKPTLAGTCKTWIYCRTGIFSLWLKMKQIKNLILIEQGIKNINFKYKSFYLVFAGC